MLVLSPGNALDEIRGNPHISREFIEALEKKYHLDDQNIFRRYWYWVWPAVRGDFGVSIRSQVPVWNMIGERTLNTLMLTGSALLFSWLIAIPLGVMAALYRNRWIDKLCSFISFFGLSIPSVFFSLLCVLFAAKTGLFPVGGIHDQANWYRMTMWEKFADTLHHLILPTMVLGTIGLAQYMRQMRSEMIETLSQITYAPLWRKG